MGEGVPGAFWSISIPDFRSALFAITPEWTISIPDFERPHVAAASEWTISILRMQFVAEDRYGQTLFLTEMAKRKRVCRTGQTLAF
jgi:hypothetical protein